MSPKTAAILPNPILFAHRGGKANGPENEIKTFKRTLEQMKDVESKGLETDVRLTKDGVPVLFHDAAFWGKKKIRISKTRISSVSQESLPQKILTLSNLYRDCRGDHLLSLDIKDLPKNRSSKEESLEIIQPILSIVGDMSKELNTDLSERLFLCSGDIQQLRFWREFSPDINLVHSTKPPKQGERHLSDLREAGITALNMNKKEWSGGMVALCHRFDILAFAWDANQEREVIELLNMGMDAVYGDYPDRLISGHEKVYPSPNAP